MNTEISKEQAKAMLPEYLRELGIDPHKMFRCICSNHTDTHPSMSYDWNRNKVHCFSCHADMDIFDVYQSVNHLADMKEAFRGVYSWIENRNNQRLPERLPNTVLKAEKTDLTKEVIEAHEALRDDQHTWRHFALRGISADVVEQYKLGVCPKGMNAFLRNHTSMQSQSILQSRYKYILPYPDENNGFTYFQAEIDDRNLVDSMNGKYRKPKGIREPIFNERYLLKSTPEVIFLVEGIYDALSVETAGGKAIALGGTGYRRFLELVEQKHPKTVFVISADNDDAGDRLREQLEKGLQKIGASFKVQSVPVGKDFNEFLMKNSKSANFYVKKTIELCKEKRSRVKDEPS